MKSRLNFGEIKNREEHSIIAIWSNTFKKSYQFREHKNIL